MKRLFSFLNGDDRISASICAAAAAQTPRSPKTVYIRAGHLFDGTGDKSRDNMVIVVLGDRIQSVAPAGAVAIPAGATVVDLSHATVLAWIDRLPHAPWRSR